MGSIEINKKQDMKCIQKDNGFNQEAILQNINDQIQQDPLSKAFSKGILNSSIIASNNKLDMNNIQNNIINGQKDKIKSNKRRVSLQNNILNYHYDQIKQNQQQKKQQSNLKIKKITQINQIFNTKRQSIKSEPLFKRISISQQNIIKINNKNINNFYILQVKIGHGSFGVVYKGICKRTLQPRAIKCIKQQYLDFQKRQNILKQIKILIKMNHPNIIKTYQVIQDQNYFYIITQLCEGGSIKILKLHQKKCNQYLIKKIMKKILSAVRYIHSLNVVHRDIKLQNIVFQKIIIDDKQDIIIKIIDFGLAKQINQCQSIQNQLAGTILFMPPQAIHGYTSFKWDIWSCGVILYILLMGYNPFQAKSRQDIFYKIKNKMLTFKAYQWNFVTKQARDLLYRMLNKQYLKRISSKQILQHAWFKNMKSLSKNNQKSKTLINTIIPRLLKYRRRHNLYVFMQHFISFTKLNQIDRQHFTRFFNQIDVNQDGYISKIQLKTYLNNQQIKMDENQIQQLVKKIDHNQNDYIDLNQFFCAAFDREKYLNSYSFEVMQDIFNFLDENNDGFIDNKQLMNILGLKQNEQLLYYYQIFNKSINQKIQKQQFFNYIKNIQTNQ